MKASKDVYLSCVRVSAKFVRRQGRTEYRKRKVTNSTFSMLGALGAVGQQVASEPQQGGRIPVAEDLAGILKHLYLNKVIEISRYAITSFSIPRKTHFYPSL